MSVRVLDSILYAIGLMIARIQQVLGIYPNDNWLDCDHGETDK